MLQNELSSQSHPENNEGSGRLNIRELLDQVHSLIPAEGDVYFNEIKGAMTVGISGHGTMFADLEVLSNKYKSELNKLRLEQKNPEPVYSNDLEMTVSNWDVNGKIDTLERIIPWLEAVPEVLK